MHGSGSTAPAAYLTVCLGVLSQFKALKCAYLKPEMAPKTKKIESAGRGGGGKEARALASALARVVAVVVLCLCGATNGGERGRG